MTGGSITLSWSADDPFAVVLDFKRLGIDLPAAVDAKTRVVFRRGWKDPR